MPIQPDYDNPSAIPLPTQPVERYNKEQEAKREHSQMEQAAAAFRVENVPVSAYMKHKAGVPSTMDTKPWGKSGTMLPRGDMARMQKPLDPDFDPIALIPEDLSSFAEEFAYANNAEEVNAMSKHIRRQLHDHHVLAESGLSGMGWTFAAAFTSPEMLMPLGAAGKAGTLLTKVKSFAKAGFIGSSASEVLLHSTQNARTLETSMYSIAAGTVLSAGLGGAVHGVQKALGSGAYTAARDAVAADLSRIGKEADDAPATRADDAPARTDDPDAPVPDRSMGAAETNPALRAEAEEAMLAAEGVYSTKKLKATEAVGDVIENLPLLGRGIKLIMNPVKRMLDSPILEVRQFVQKLQDPSLVLEKNATGQATEISAAAAQRLRMTQVAKAASNADEEYVKYVMGRNTRFAGVARSTLAAKLSSKAGDWKLTYGEFRDAVGKAMRNDDSADRLIERGLIPEAAKDSVEAAAKAYRKEVYDPILKELQEGEWLPEDIDVKTAESYLNRVYDRVALLQQSGVRQRFLDETVGWLTERQDISNRNIERFDTEHAALKNDIQFIKQKIQAIGESANEAASKAVYERLASDLDEILEESPVMDALARVSELEELKPRGKKTKTEAQMHEAATKKAREAFMRSLRNSLTDDVQDMARAAGDDAVDEAVRGVIGKLDDMADDAKLDFVLAETPKPITRAVVETVDSEFAKGMSRAELEAHHAAAAAYDASLKAQIKAAIKSGSHDGRSPEDLLKALTAEFRRAAKREADKAGKRAATAATKELKLDLAKKVSEAKERVATHRRDLHDSELDADDMLTTANTILLKITNTGGELGYDISVPTKQSYKGAGGKSGTLKERKFLIPDERIEFALVNDIEKAAGHYAMGAGRDLELMKRFDGKTDPLEIWASMDLDRAFRNMKEGLDDKGLQAVEAKQAQTKRDIIETIDVFRGRHGVPDDPTSWGAPIIRNLKRWNYVSKLGGMVLSATADAGKLPAVHGYDKLFRYALTPLIKHTKGIRLLKGEIAQLKLITEMHDNTRARFLEGLGEDTWHYNWVDRSMGAMADTFGIPSLMAPWNQFFKTADAVITMQRIMDISADEAAGRVISDSDSLFLRSNFIDKEISQLIAEQVSKHGETVDGVTLPKVDQWDDIKVGRHNTPISEVFKMAIQRQADNTVVSGSLEVPAITKTQLGSIMFQFRAFAFLTIPKTTQRMAQESSEAKVLAGVSTMIALGMLSYAMKEKVAGRDLSDDPLVWIAEGIDRAGILGSFGDLANTMDKVAYGPRKMMGIQQASRYQSRNAIGSLLGPTFGTASGVLGVVSGLSGSAGEWLGGDGRPGWSESDTRTLKRLLPYNNLFYLNAIYNNAIMD